MREESNKLEINEQPETAVVQSQVQSQAQSLGRSPGQSQVHSQSHSNGQSQDRPPSPSQIPSHSQSQGLSYSQSQAPSHGHSQSPAQPPTHMPPTGTSRLLPAAILIVLILLAAAGTFWYMQDNAGQKEKLEKAARQEKLVPVLTTKATEKALSFELRSIGNVTPYSMVNIVPQVGGQITKVFFTQGEYIHKGDPLFQIDPRPYQAALNQAEGNVARDQAQIEAAQANLAKDQAQIGHAEANLAKDRAQAEYANVQKKRYAELVTQGAVSHEQSDQYDTNYVTAKATIDADLKVIENATAITRADKAAIDTARGTLKADQGIAEQARIQLGWTKITSPIEGLIGSLKVYEGNVVTANTLIPLVSIAQTDPIYVSVTVPEQYLNDLRRAQREGTLTLEAMVEGRRAEAVKGDISFMENTVNTSTGTILLRAKFANKEQKLFPGQFVDVVIKMPPAGNSVVVPSRAVVTTQQGNSVYVVNQDQTVKLITVKVGQTAGGETAILEGLNSGEEIVIDGQLQLSPGAKVKIKQEDSPSKM